MILIRFLLIAFNVAIIGFLIYRMIEVVKQPMERSKKAMILIGGTLLLLAPLGIFFRFFAPTPQYFLVYPVAIFMFLYLTKQLSIR
jgi:amino acid transporter